MICKLTDAYSEAPFDKDNLISNRILNGIEARIEDYPFQVCLLINLVTSNKTARCGGTIINRYLDFNVNSSLCS